MAAVGFKAVWIAKGNKKDDDEMFQFVDDLDIPENLAEEFWDIAEDRHIPYPIKIQVKHYTTNNYTMELEWDDLCYEVSLDSGVFSFALYNKDTNADLNVDRGVKKTMERYFEDREKDGQSD